MVQKECVVCGIVFIATANHRACSEKCRQELMLRRRSRNARAKMCKVCVICGEAFAVTSNGRQKTCGKQCSNKLDSKRRGRTLEPRKCVVCGIELTDCRGTTKTCEGECRRKRKAQLKSGKQYVRNREKARKAYAAWIAIPENRQRVRESQRKYAAKQRCRADVVAKRKLYDEKRREWKKRKDLKAYQAERRRIDALCRRKKLSEMTNDELIAHRKKKAAEMREWVKKNPDKRKANRIRSRSRQNLKAATASVAVAVKTLKTLEENRNA